MKPRFLGRHLGRLALCGAAVFGLGAGRSVAPLPTVPSVDLAREPGLDAGTFGMLVGRARCLGFAVDQLVGCPGAG